MDKKVPSRIRRKRNIKIKKSTLGMFAAIFAFVFAMFHVFAGENNTFSAEEYTGASRGEEIYYNVSLDCQKEYNSGMLTVSFDPAVLEYVEAIATPYINPSASKGKISLTSVFASEQDEIDAVNETGKLEVGFAATSMSKAACESIEDFVQITFNVKDDAPYGRSPVTIEEARMAKEVTGQDKEIVAVDTEAGYVELALPVDPDSVELEEDTFTIQKGETDNIVVLYEPENTTDDKTFTYTGYDEDVISVASNGTITANGVGTTTVTVTAFGKTLTASVTVVNHITTVTISGSGHNIEKDEEIQLTAEVLPADTDDSKTLTWASSSEGVATVDQTGKVTGVSGGTTTISATSVNDVVGTYEINVVVPITSFTTTDANLELAKSDTHTINYTINPENATEDKTITWASSDEAVATVSNGVIAAMGGGTATITGTLPAGKNNIAPITIDVTVNVPLVSISLDKETLELLPTQNYDLKVTFNPSDATDKAVTWSSDTESVATVDENGKVTAVAAGDAVITATAGGKSDTVSVHVLKEIKGAVINKNETTINKGANDQLSVTFNPEDAEEDKTVSWSSSDTSVATVDSTGKVTGVSGGTATITGSILDGKFEVTCDVTVVVPLDDISLNKSTLTLDKGNNETLTVTYDPEDTTDNTTVTWTSEDDTVATVDSTGKVTAVGKGVTTITATVGTHSKNCQVTVNVPVTAVTVPDADFELARSKTKTVTATVSPDDASDKTVTWKSSDTSVATVDSNGVVTAVAAGTATITATAGGKSDTVKVTVIVPITEFAATETTMELLRKESKTISTTINPNDTTESKTITWTSNKTGVATVDENGKVTGVGEGQAVITGALANGMSVTVNVTVSIIPVTSIELNKDKVNINRKQSDNLTVTYSPENATEVDDVTWTSSDEKVATVEKGKVTGVGEGTATITATMGGLTATAEVTVKEIPATGVSAEDNPKTTEVGADYTIVPKLEPYDATDDVTYTYESSDPEIATVDENGKVTTKKAGKVTITIKASNGVTEFEDTIELTVKTPSSPQTGVTSIWVYGGIIAVLLIAAIVIYKKKELF